MSESVYDLGVIDDAPAPPPPKSSPPRAPGRTVRSPRPVVFSHSFHTPVEPPVMGTVANSLALLVPGGGAMLRGRLAEGMLVLSSCGFLGVLGYAVWSSRERFPDTLTALGFPAHGAIYLLEIIFACLACVHVAGIVSGVGRGHDRGPAVLVGLASAFVPGWGQAWNRQPLKTALFVAAAWAIAFAWIWASPWTTELLEAQGAVRRENLGFLTSPAVLWTAPIVVWALSVYDAVMTASR